LYKKTKKNKHLFILTPDYQQFKLKFVFITLNAIHKISNELVSLDFSYEIHTSMILSMTGYGAASTSFLDKNFSFEIKTLNSKTGDFRIKLPAGLGEKEIWIRKMISDAVSRGRVEASFTIEAPNYFGEYQINTELIKKYYQQLHDLQNELGIPESDLINAIMRIPNVIGTDSLNLTEEEWHHAEQVIIRGLQNLNIFRAEEGRVTARELELRVQNICALLTRIEPLESNRIRRIKDRLRKNLEEFIVQEKIDLNRFEQEILYYLEKIDISEEKLRLGQHCDYFLQLLHNDDEQVGKILNFISQEMGREINTLGSKAQDSEMQQIIVMMKDDLEKIKEQLANIL